MANCSLGRSEVSLVQVKTVIEKRKCRAGHEARTLENLAISDKEAPPSQVPAAELLHPCSKYLTYAAVPEPITNRWRPSARAANGESWHFCARFRSAEVAISDPDDPTAGNTNDVLAKAQQSLEYASTYDTLYKRNLGQGSDRSLPDETSKGNPSTWS